MSIAKNRRHLLRLAARERLEVATIRNGKGTHRIITFKTRRGGTFNYVEALAGQATQRQWLNIRADLRRLKRTTDELHLQKPPNQPAC